MIVLFLRNTEGCEVVVTDNIDFLSLKPMINVKLSS